MSKTFSDQERAHIKARLIEEAEICLTIFGLQKTTVDELVKRVNIPKGTFYLFYESKYLLFFDVFNKFHNDIQARLILKAEEIKDNIDAKKLTALIIDLFRTVEESFILKFMTNGDLEILMRKLPPEVALAHAEHDDFSFENLVSMIPNLKQINIKAFSASFRAVFLSMLHKHEIGEDVFDEALEIMLYGIIIQLFEGEDL